MASAWRSQSVGSRRIGREESRPAPAEHSPGYQRPQSQCPAGEIRRASTRDHRPGPPQGGLQSRERSARQQRRQSSDVPLRDLPGRANLDDGHRRSTSSAPSLASELRGTSRNAPRSGRVGGRQPAPRALSSQRPESRESTYWSQLSHRARRALLLAGGTSTAVSMFLFGFAMGGVNERQNGNRYPS